MARFLEIVPIGLASGMLSGAFGVGGGIITVPLIRHLIGVSAHIAVGNSLAVILPTSIIGMINYLKQGKLVPALALYCGGPAVLGTVIASLFSHQVRGQVLMLVLAGLMILVGLDFVTGFGTKLRKAGESAENSDGLTKTELDQRKIHILIVLGLFTGILSGMLGVGGGFIMVPSFCYFLSMPLKIAFGTSLIVVALVALPGTIIHAIEGHVQLDIVIPMLLGSLPGAWLGSFLALKTKDRLLRIIFGVILLIMSVVFAYRELTGATV